MNKFELIDDYLANRLPEAERKDFEQSLDGDPSLRNEVEIQKSIVEGVRKARALELKAMLNQVPVGGNGWSAGKAAAVVVGAGLVAASLYYYMQPDAVVDSVQEEAPAAVSEQPVSEPATPKSEPAEQPVTKEPAATSGPETKPKPDNKEPKASTPVRKPDLQVVDPSEEMKESTAEDTESAAQVRQGITTSKMEVAIQSEHKKYGFHYQFADGKLVLYGPFDKTLYEVLEINSDNHLIFLYYRENYYLLDERQQNVAALTPIRDSQLLKKLKEYRGGN